MVRLNCPVSVQIVLITCFIFSNLLVSAQQQSKNVIGTVFEDINKNSKPDTGEKGIPCVLVSNRNVVVRTDKYGKYQLTIDQEDDIVFIIKPSGYTLPLNDKNLPQFYYIHKPMGSPELKYPVIQPTGELPEAVNFPLYPSTVTDTFDVIVLADPQPLVPEDLNYLRDDIVAELAGIRASFGIVLGDIVWDNLSLYDHYNTIMAVIEKPFYHAAGNHDFNYNAQNNHTSLETFNRFFGPEYYAFEYGQVSFLILNSVGWNEELPEKTRYTYEGRIDNKQQLWIKDYLQHVPDERLVVLCMHIPFLSYAGSKTKSNVTNRREIFELLKERKHLLAINGHLHKTENMYLEEIAGRASDNPIHQISCTTASGALWGGPKDTRGIPVAYQSDGTPNGYHVFHFYGNKYSQQYKAANEDDGYQIRISSPSGMIMKNAMDTVLVVANFFNGNERANVVFQVDDNNPVVMNRTVMRDPFIVKHMAQYPDSYYEWERPAESIHIWTSPLPADLASGAHKIKVRATDQYGNDYEEIAVFEVE